jgi:hypothetical protein
MSVGVPGTSLTVTRYEYADATGQGWAISFGSHSGRWHIREEFPFGPRGYHVSLCEEHKSQHGIYWEPKTFATAEEAIDAINKI